MTGPPPRLGKPSWKTEKSGKLRLLVRPKVGKTLIRQSADQVKRLSLELGGHAPMIVFDDANLDVAVKAVIASKFRNTVKRAFVVTAYMFSREYTNHFWSKFADSVNQLQLVTGMGEEVDIGPLINYAALEKSNITSKMPFIKGLHL